MNQDTSKPEDRDDQGSSDGGQEPYDPRPVSDAELREEYTREEVERWRQEADEHHTQWFSVMENDYGRD
jgi:hypothetical protein